MTALIALMTVQAMAAVVGIGGCAYCAWLAVQEWRHPVIGWREPALVAAMALLFGASQGALVMLAASMFRP